MKSHSEAAANAPGAPPSPRRINLRRLSPQMREHIETANREAYDRGRADAQPFESFLIGLTYGALVGAALAAVIVHELDAHPWH